jgi:hypothetical protein
LQPKDEILKQEIKEEERKVRYLRLVVDLSLSQISRGEVSEGDALEMFHNVRRQALMMFPGKEDTFDIVYSPRFRRMISEVYGTDWEL